MVVVIGRRQALRFGQLKHLMRGQGNAALLSSLQVRLCSAAALLVHAASSAQAGKHASKQDVGGSCLCSVGCKVSTAALLRLHACAGDAEGLGWACGATERAPCSACVRAAPTWAAAVASSACLVQQVFCSGPKLPADLVRPSTDHLCASVSLQCSSSAASERPARAWTCLFLSVPHALGLSCRAGLQLRPEAQLLPWCSHSTSKLLSYGTVAACCPCFAALWPRLQNCQAPTLAPASPCP